MKKLTTLCALATVALFSAAGPASAQSIRLDLDASATATENGTEILQRSATSTRSGNASPAASDRARENANVNSRINVSNASATNSFNTLNGNTVGGSATTTFVLTRGDIRDDSATTTDPSAVSSRSDFEAYARAVMASDENVVRIESSDSAVSLTYREPAKFLGIIPVMVSAKATVSSDGTVTVSYPWWYAIFVKAEDPNGLERSLTSTAGTIARAEGGIELSSSLQARLVNALRTGMKEYHEATIATGTSTDMTAE